MGIFGCGVDIVENSRIRKIFEKNFERFVCRIFSAEEIVNNDFSSSDYCKVAGRWAAKEAFVKAIGTGFSKSFLLRDVKVLQYDSGRPRIVLSAKAEQSLLSKLDNLRYNVHCSISHESLFSVAQVIVEVR